MALLNICDDAPRWDDYLAARKRQAGLADASETVDAAKREVNDPKSPATRKRLDELDREIETITRDVLEIPDMKIDFASAAQPIAARPALDLGAAPTLD